MKNASSILKEYNLSTDHFQQPKENTGKSAVGLLIARLVLLEPGTNPNRPNMGLGLISRFREMFPDKLSTLKKELYSQLETYLPSYANVEIILTAKEHQLIFDIKVDDNVYKYVMVEQEDNRVTLSELLEES